MATTTNGEGHFKKARAVVPLTITQMTQVIAQIYSISLFNFHLNCANSFAGSGVSHQDRQGVCHEAPPRIYRQPQRSASPVSSGR